MRLVYPPSVTGSSDPPLLTLLQGPVQRVDLLFTSDSCVKAGKIYLQIDATPNSAAAAFFWYPITSSSNASTDDAAALDAVSFHPIALNSLMQPAHPLLLPALIEEKSSFSVPLFLRSEKHGMYSNDVCHLFIHGKYIINDLLIRFSQVRSRSRRLLSISLEATLPSRLRRTLSSTLLSSDR